MTALKGGPETLWLKEADSQMLQQALRDVERAFDAFFEKRSRFPRFRSKKAGNFTFRIPQRVGIEGGRVYVPKVGWVRIRQSRQVEYKAAWGFKRTIRVGRFLPSTKLCSECGKVNPNLTLSERAWLCGCGTRHDRDLNAAKNILAEGMRLLAAGQTESPINARGGPVRLPTGSTAL